jgi:hypothetical protein
MSFPSPGDGKPAASSAPAVCKQAANTNSHAHRDIIAISKLPLTVSGKANRMVGIRNQRRRRGRQQPTVKPWGNDARWIQAPNGAKESGLFFSD